MSATVINLVELERQVVVLLDDLSNAALTVIRTNDRIVSWWSGRVSADVAVQGFRESGMVETDIVPPSVMAQILKHWGVVADARKQFP